MTEQMSEQMSAGIVVGVDGSEASNAAVAWAAHESELRRIPLTLVHVVVPTSPVVSPAWPGVPAPADVARAQREHARHVLELAGKLAAASVSADRAGQIQAEVMFGAVVSTLVARTARAEMVVVGCRGQAALARVLLGSVSSGLIHHAHCPVAVIHDGDQPAPDAPIVVGIDGSAASESATAIAFDEASRRGVELIALHAWSDMGPLDFGRPGQAPVEWTSLKVGEEEVLAERLAGWRSRYPDVSVHRVVVADRPAPRLLERAETAQLLVVGSHGRGGFAGMLLGSVGSTVAQAARIPVIVARPRDVRR